MKASFSSVCARVAGLCGLLAALAVGLPACQQQRLARLEAVQLEQARELADLRQQLAAKEEEVTQLETCVDDLESAVYEDDSTAYDDENFPRPLVQL